MYISGRVLLVSSAVIVWVSAAVLLYALPGENMKLLVGGVLGIGIACVLAFFSLRRTRGEHEERMEKLFKDLVEALETENNKTPE